MLGVDRGKCLPSIGSTRCFSHEKITTGSGYVNSTTEANLVFVKHHLACARCQMRHFIQIDAGTCRVCRVIACGRCGRLSNRSLVIYNICSDVAMCRVCCVIACGRCSGLSDGSTVSHRVWPRRITMGRCDGMASVEPVHICAGVCAGEVTSEHAAIKERCNCEWRLGNASRRIEADRRKSNRLKTPTHAPPKKATPSRSQRHHARTRRRPKLARKAARRRPRATSSRVNDDGRGDDEK